MADPIPAMRTWQPGLCADLEHLEGSQDIWREVRAGTWLQCHQDELEVGDTESWARLSQGAGLPAQSRGALLEEDQEDPYGG